MGVRGAGGGSSPARGPGPGSGGQGSSSGSSTAVERVVSALTGVTQRLPGPVGSAGTQALQSVGNTLDGALPPPTHGQH